MQRIPTGAQLQSRTYTDVPDSTRLLRELPSSVIAIPCNQEDEYERLAETFYTKNLTQKQVNEVFQNIYGDLLERV